MSEAELHIQDDSRLEKAKLTGGSFRKQKEDSSERQVSKQKFVVVIEITTLFVSNASERAWRR
jgi:hypothetical protein